MAQDFTYLLAWAEATKTPKKRQSVQDHLIWFFEWVTCFLIAAGGLWELPASLRGLAIGMGFLLILLCLVFPMVVGLLSVIVVGIARMLAASVEEYTAAKATEKAEAVRLVQDMYAESRTNLADHVGWWALNTRDWLVLALRMGLVFIGGDWLGISVGLALFISAIASTVICSFACTACRAILVDTITSENMVWLAARQPVGNLKADGWSIRSVSVESGPNPPT